MRVLWITNILLPDISEYLGIKPPVIGGWMNSSLNAIKDLDSTLSFAVGALYDGKELLEKEIDDVTYFCIPRKGKQMPFEYDSSFEKYWVEVKNRYNPDLVHIHGSEFQHGLAYLKVNGNKNAILSIQGCVSAISRYADGLIEHEVWRKHRSFVDLVKMKSQRKFIIDNYKKRSGGEIEYFKSLENIIGRTNWDRTHAEAINPDIRYFFCNETLRPQFYNSRWNLRSCINNRIFLSQASEPLKGFHQVIKALPLILRKFPNTQVYIAGDSPITKNRLRRSTYANYLLSLMKETGTADKIHFTGQLNEKNMIDMYLSSHVFVCPSSIENSPNSLGEAQLLGVPSVASYVGGIPDMIEQGISGMYYRFEEYEIMAAHICNIFKHPGFANELSQGGSITARKRHSSQTNAIDTINIYNEVADIHVNVPVVSTDLVG